MDKVIGFCEMDKVLGFCTMDKIGGFLLIAFLAWLMYEAWKYDERNHK